MAKNTLKKLILKNHQSAGDITLLAYAIKALHEQYPKQYLTDVDTTYDDIFIGNPYITKLDKHDPKVRILDMQYPTINFSNQRPYQSVNGFVWDLAKKLKIKLEATDWKGAVWITSEEQAWWSQIFEILHYNPPYWIIDAGHKWDYTAKAWDFERYQAIVDAFPELWFVQIGQPEHNHPKLTGNNLINLVGKTDARQFIRLMWHSFGVITPISWPMHLAYAVPPHPRFNRKARACIVIAGGREPNHWQTGPDQQFIHTCGMLDCCDDGGCWKSRVVPIGDGDHKDQDLCVDPVLLPSGQYIGKCFDLITVDEVCLLIRRYMTNLKAPIETAPKPEEPQDSETNQPEIADQVAEPSE